jgi:hypothetical protein
MAYVDFGFFAVGAFPEESNLKRRPSDRLVSLEDACIVAVAVAGLDAVDSPGFVTSIESFGQDSGMQESAADIVLETWNTVVVASHVP